MSSIPFFNQYQTTVINYNSAAYAPNQDAYFNQANSYYLRLFQKVNFVFSQMPKPIYSVDWDDKRAFTPGGLCGYRSLSGLVFLDFQGDGYVKLFNAHNEMQGLVLHNNQVAGASVSTDVKNEKQRSTEKKITYVQYDKKYFTVDKRAFEIDPTYANAKGKQVITYQGSHLIDYEFGSSESHEDSQNYIPGHHFYNQSIKRYLANRSDAFIEIPLYTPNPPLAKTNLTYLDQRGLKQPIRHPIPIGLIFIQLKKKSSSEAFQDIYTTQDIYFFPNNQFDYEGFANKFTAKNTKAENTVSFFRLKKNLHVFFQPGIIYDFSQLTQGFDKQVKEEKQFLKIIEDVTSCMSLDSTEDHQKLTTFIFDVLYKKAIDPRKIWECDEQLEFFKVQPYSLPLNSLCEFLMKYVLKNALKSEVISAKCRLIFVNAIANLIQMHKMEDPEKPEIPEEIIDFIECLENEFSIYLKELNNLAQNMNLDELIFLAHIYKTLTDALSNMSNPGDDLLSDSSDFELNFRSFIKTLQILTKNFKVESLDNITKIKILLLFGSAQETLEYFFDLSPDFKDQLKEETDFLKQIRPSCLKMLDSLPVSVNNKITLSSLDPDKNCFFSLPKKYLENSLKDLGEI